MADRDEPLCRCLHEASRHHEDGCCGEHDCYCTEYRYDRERARERRLAELAMEIYDWLVIQNDLSPIDRDWLRRYEEAVK